MLLSDIRKVVPDVYVCAKSVQGSRNGLTVALGMYIGDNVVQLSAEGQKIMAAANPAPSEPEVAAANPAPSEPEVVVVKAKK